MEHTTRIRGHKQIFTCFMTKSLHIRPSVTNACKQIQIMICPKWENKFQPFIFFFSLSNGETYGLFFLSLFPEFGFMMPNYE